MANTTIEYHYPLYHKLESLYISKTCGWPKFVIFMDSIVYYPPYEFPILDYVVVMR